MSEIPNRTKIDERSEAGRRFYVVTDRVPEAPNQTRAGVGLHACREALTGR